MFRPGSALASLIAVVVAAAVVVSVSGTPISTAAEPTLLEAESMSVSPRYAGRTVADANASGRTALALTLNSTASKALALSAPAQVVVRSAGRMCNGAPVMNVVVDGRVVAKSAISATSWTEYTVPTQIAAGSHTIGVAFTNQYASFGCYRALLVDRITIVAAATPTSTTPTTTPPTTTPPTTTPPTTTPPTTTPNTKPLFAGDYSTGDFKQWLYVQNSTYNGPASGYTPSRPAAIVADPAKGNVARYEVRSGEPASGEANTVNRSEVAAGTNTGGTEGQTLWYQFSTKFDPAFPKNHRDLGWGLTNQWHQDVDTGSPPIGWYVDQRNGYWSLTIQKQSSPGVYLQTFSIFDVPLGTDWHDVTMQIRWSASDNVGFVRLWLNGVRQTFVNGSDTYYVRTLIPGTRTVYYKEGYYRKAMQPTGIVYHTGFRVATDVQ